MALSSRLLRICALPRACFRKYHSYDHPPSPGPFNSIEAAILSASLAHIPAHGFSDSSLAQGAKDTGYIDASANLFSRGAFSLVHYYLMNQRAKLGERSQAQLPEQDGKYPSVGAKVKMLTWERLLSNKQVIHKWQEALALMALPDNISTSLHELASLSDEIWFLSGDTSVDTSWYTKRATLSTIYAAADLFMTTDKSEGFVHTKDFLDRRFEDSLRIGAAVGSLGEWIGFTAGAGINVLRSKGVRI